MYYVSPSYFFVMSIYSPSGGSKFSIGGVAVGPLAEYGSKPGSICKYTLL